MSGDLVPCCSSSEWMTWLGDASCSLPDLITELGPEEGSGLMEQMDQAPAWGALAGRPAGDTTAKGMAW